MKIIRCSVCGKETPNQYLDDRCRSCSSQGRRKKPIPGENMCSGFGQEE